MKNMKKKVIIIAAMVLLLATVLVMSMSTFAKYRTAATPASNSATVAKWGFVLTANADNLFPNQYGEADAAEIADAWVTDEGVSVKGKDGACVVAPGTTGYATLTVNGTAEVRAKLSFSVSGNDIYLTKGDGDNAQTYNPIVWTLKEGDTTLATGSLADITAHEVILEAGDVLSNKVYTLSWTWAFENAATGIDGLDANAADTMLASETLAEGYTANKTLSFTLDAAIEQIQASAPVAE